MHFAYIGNFDPPHSTENHVKQALEGLGHQVKPFQENAGLTAWELNPSDYDVVLWTRTKWDWENTQYVHELQQTMLQKAKQVGVPTVGFHLDRWWGLPRQSEIYTEPFFKVSLLVTADGGHDDLWQGQGINHFWLPPGVSLYECKLGRYDRKYAADIAFVGSWQNYHPEWPHRAELVNFLSKFNCQFFPANGEAVRGEELRNLYATTTINVGDSCLVNNATHYWSDRIPETLGRGGFLIHPNVEGLEQHFVPGEHLATWDLGNWDELKLTLWCYLQDYKKRNIVAQAGRAHVLEHHTYHVRMKQLIEML